MNNCGLKIAQPPLFVVSLVFFEPNTWPIKKCHYIKPNEVNDWQAKTKIERPEQKWYLWRNDILCAIATCEENYNYQKMNHIKMQNIIEKWYAAIYGHYSSKPIFGVFYA